MLWSTLEDGTLKLYESVPKTPPYFQQKADEVSFVPTDSVLHNASILIDRCAAYLGKKTNRVNP